MNIELIKKIPEAINDPIMILKSKTNPQNSVVIITDIKTSKGEMIVPVWIKQDGVYLDVYLDKPTMINTNFVASAYGRSTKGLIEFAFKNEGLLYVNSDNKKVGKLLTRHGLQLPAPLKISNFTNSISNSEENVNTNDKSAKYSLVGLSNILNREVIFDILVGT